MLKDQIKEIFPLAHRIWRFLKGFFTAAFKYRKLTFNRELIEHILWCKYGEAQLNLLYKSGNSQWNPLRLDIIETHKLQPSVLPGYYHYNPTLQLEDENIRVFWRVSDFSLVNFHDELGRWHRENLNDLENFERIATGVLDSRTGLNFWLISDETVLPEQYFINRVETAKALGRENDKIYVEDPRAHEGTGRYLTAHARFGKVGKNFYRMLLVDLATNSAIIVPSSDSNKTEKNWVVIREFEDYLLFLNQSNPPIINKVNLKTGISERAEIQEEEIQLNSKNLNGGSPFVRIDCSHFLRVARHMFPIYPLGGCRISVLVLHDSEFKEVARSKPFVFNKLGVEICNGLVIKDDSVYFSWGEDDIAMYVGKCTKDDLMSWFNRNLQN